MDYESKYERYYNHEKNLKTHDRKLMVQEIRRSNQRKNKKLSAHYYYKNKYKNHNKLKTEKIGRSKNRDGKYNYS